MDHWSQGRLSNRVTAVFGIIEVRQRGPWGHKWISSRVTGLFREGLFRAMRHLEVRKNSRGEVTRVQKDEVFSGQGN